MSIRHIPKSIAIQIQWECVITPADRNPGCDIQPTRQQCALLIKTEA